MTPLWKNKEALARFPKTVAAIALGDLYPHCPRCDGERHVIVYTCIGDGFRPTRGEYINCPLCHATGEADAEQALAYVKDALEKDES